MWKLLTGGAVMTAALLLASGTGYAAPVYIGLQVAGYNGGAIPTRRSGAT
jgi:hypothetical protein